MQCGLLAPLNIIVLDKLSSQDGRNLAAEAAGADHVRFDCR